MNVHMLWRSYSIHRPSYPAVGHVLVIHGSLITTAATLAVLLSTDLFPVLNMNRLPDEILSKILMWIPLPSKFLLSSVSLQWSRVSMHLIRKQSCLVITCVPNFKIKQCLCVARHPRHHLDHRDIVMIGTEDQMIRITRCIFTHCPAIKAVALPGPHWVRNSDLSQQLIQRISHQYGDQMECFSCSEFGTNLPAMASLMHLSLPAVTDVDAIFNICPFIDALQLTDLNHSFNFPSGLKVLKFMSESAGLEQLFRSPACTSLQVLSFRSSLNDSLMSAQFVAPNLKYLLFHGSMVSQVLGQFLHSLGQSNQLQVLDLLSLSGDDMPVSHWNQLFTHVPDLRKLRIPKPSLGASTIENLVQSCPHLQELCLVDCHLTDQSLGQLGSLRHLNCLELTFNCNPLSETGILLLIRGQCRPKLSKLLINKSKGSFVTEEVRNQLLWMRELHALTACKLSCDNGSSFDLNHPDDGLDPLRDVCL